MSLKLPCDFAKKIADVLNFKAEAVDEWFDVFEDKNGYFIAALRPKKWLSDLQFKGMCALARDLKGEYVKEGKAFKVPGPMAKKPPASTPGPAVPAAIKATGQSTAQTEGTQIFMPILLPLTAFVHMPFRSRVNIDGPEFEELVESVKVLGILQPLVVRFLKTGFYEIVAGERRFRAAERLKLTSVPCVIHPLTDEQAYEVQLVENIQRKDLSDMEKARMLDYMVKTFQCTQEALAKKLGKGQSWVSQHLAMLQIPENITRVIKQGELTEGQAREILAAPEERREAIIDKINETGAVPSIREIRNIVHPEEAKPLKPQDMTPGKARELLDTPAGKEVLETAVKERLAEGPVEGAGESEEEEGPLYADSIETVPEESKESIPNAHEPSKESIPRPMEKVHAKDEKIDTGFEFCCPECQLKFQILHVKRGDGKIEHCLEAKY